jgi:hypothetical protein
MYDYNKLPFFPAMLYPKFTAKRKTKYNKFFSRLCFGFLKIKVEQVIDLTFLAFACLSDYYSAFFDILPSGLSFCSFWLLSAHSLHSVCRVATVCIFLYPSSLPFAFLIATFFS